MDVGGLESSYNNIMKLFCCSCRRNMKDMKELQEVSSKERYVENISDEEAKT